MLFNSVGFLIFFPAIALLFYSLPHKFRWLMLLIASCLFYMSFIPIYIFVLFATITVDYIAGILIENSQNTRRKQIYLSLSIFFTVLILFIFKYFNFFNANISGIASFFHWNYPIGLLRLILPIGLSFHTFQSLSYVIEVYRGNQKAEHNFGIYSLYVMFFPQLVAGPIERPQHLLHQFYEEHKVNSHNIKEGLRQMLGGYFKKVVIADRLAAVVNTVYGNPTSYTGLTLILATVLFAFQIYCDFAGYSDIAIGCAKAMGFTLMRNFNRPYLSKSISEFWNRWHISLSSWLKDYIYIPLGGNRVAIPRWCANVLITFLVSGLWHGANWTYILWGALFGIYLVASRLTQGARGNLANAVHLDRHPRVYDSLAMLATFTFVNIGWVLFRASSMTDAVYILTHMLKGISLDRTALNIGSSLPELIVSITLILVLIAYELMQDRVDIIARLKAKPKWLRWSVYYALIVLILLLGQFGTRQFIYFQF